MSDYLMKCLGKGVADVEQQQDAAERIEELEATLAKAEVIVRIVASDKLDERLGEAVDLSCEYLAAQRGEKTWLR